MEFVPGRTLEHLVRAGLHSTGGLSLGPGLRWQRVFADVASGLDYAHSQQIVHRDVKPDNIMVQEDGLSKVMDFGISKLLFDGTTTKQTVVGTPQYMAPEQWFEDKVVDGRADQYSLAVIAYRLVSGSLPFTANSLGSLCAKVQHEEPRGRALQ